MAFRIGRRSAQHSYPQAPRGAPSAYARNSAHGPATLTAVTDTPTRIPWGTLEVGAPGQNVSITPKLTGLILVTGVVECVNNSEDTDQLTVNIGVAGILQAKPLEANFVSGGGGETSVPIQAIIGPFALGTPVEVSLFVTSIADDTLSLEVNDSWITLQEVSTATG
jgi:hypothetical protein